MRVQSVIPAAVTANTRTITVAAGVFAPGHLGELTQVIPFELAGAVLAEACAAFRTPADGELTWARKLLHLLDETMLLLADRGFDRLQGETRVGVDLQQRCKWACWPLATASADQISISDGQARPGCLRRSRYTVIGHLIRHCPSPRDPAYVVGNHRDLSDGHQDRIVAVTEGEAGLSAMARRSASISPISGRKPRSARSGVSQLS